MDDIHPPMVANENANAILDEVYGAQGNDNDSIRAGRSSERLKLARNLRTSNMINAAELGEQERFHLHQVMKILPPGDENVLAPAWFGPAMAPIQAQLVNLAPIQAQLVNLAGRVDNLAGRVDNLAGRVDNLAGRVENLSQQQSNITARQSNAIAHISTDVLVPIRDDTGNVAPDFPDTLGALFALTDAQRRDLLVFYGRPANPAATREHRLKLLFGVVL